MLITMKSYLWSYKVNDFIPILDIKLRLEKSTDMPKVLWLEPGTGAAKPTEALAALTACWAGDGHVLNSSLWQNARWSKIKRRETNSII